MAITFDGPNKLILLDTVTTSLTAEEIYSRWKDWVASGVGAPYFPAFRAIGGDDIGGGQRAPAFVFLANDLGWRIKKPEANIDITIFGNLVGENPSLPLTANPVGVFTPTVGFNRSAVSSVDLSVITEMLTLTRDHARAANLQTQRV